MGNITAQLLSDVLVYKYLALFIITFLGAFALPLPSGTILIAASAFSTQGYMNFILVLGMGLAGNVAGDNANYWLARKIGIKIFKKIGFGNVLGHERMLRVRGSLEKHPVLTIFFSRFMTGIAPTVNVVAGLTELPFKTFILFEFLGEVTEVSLFCFLGFFLGSNWEYVNKFSGQFWILFVAGIVGTYLFANNVVFRKKKH